MGKFILGFIIRFVLLLVLAFLYVFFGYAPVSTAGHRCRWSDIWRTRL